MEFEVTNWEIAGASGINVKAGTPIVNVEIGGSYLRLPIRNIKTGKNVLLKGVGLGVGAGVSISTPGVSASGSLDQFPSGGIGKIIKGRAGPGRALEEKDFYGNVMVMSLSAGKEISGQLSGVLWLNKPVEFCMASLSCSRSDLRKIAQNVLFAMVGAAIPAGAVAANVQRLLGHTRAAGSFAAMNVETQLLGAGADVYTYRVNA